MMVPGSRPLSHLAKGTAWQTRASVCVRCTATQPRWRSVRRERPGPWPRSACRTTNAVWTPTMKANERPFGALIADDEPAARRGVRQLLAAFPEFVVVGECRNGADVLASLDTLMPDVVFLDVQMPGIDGFEVIRRRTPERMPPVVLLTGYDEFAIKALEVQALDYLVQP